MSNAERPPFNTDPLWYKDAVIYQAHVKSFYDGNNDGVGDFQGLTQKLDYLLSLGITCVWLLPFFPSPLKDDGYDIADYTSVHPGYGTISDFKAFVDAAHARGIRVLIELVVNHTSDQHPWFQRARSAPAGSPERNFYVWSDTDAKFPETRIIFTDTERSNWAYDPVAKQYYWHRFFSHQPDLNHNNPAVVDAVIDVMKFWLALGVDALRLDAVPYLCVREGTNNENLPETHAVLKRIRHELDASFPGRMLLAEANQWPADVRDYFGDGDECHMAFHFPLMPRMFMALQQEDRHAITEILNQTPDLPATCQWALFLRNHDELTLEMVTDEERDYMYQAYAADPQMRINVGIRRRLAPLVENSRRRIELLNMLLFSMPGTPIVYYGDEIGMGDNIYLGDRNGVRTPMQWSSDRNGGFSRADTARLFAPPVVDPVYGYPSINVEALERSPFSLLNWMKRIIALRREHRVFGRGTLEFIPCSNRKVLAYLRRFEDETVLVLANLSRSLQPADIDLSEMAGLTPVEMLGRAEFPRIASDRPYFVTLGPYAAHWFSLVSRPMQVRQTMELHQPDAADAESLPSLLVGVNWETLFDAATRQLLERQALQPFLSRQRWFASKARRVRQARIADWLMLRGGASPAFLTIVQVEYVEGESERYVLPFALLTGDAAVRAVSERSDSVLARITGARKGAVVDGLLDDGVCTALLDLAAHGTTVEGRHSLLRGERAGGLESTEALRWVRAAADSSNSLVFADDRHVLKLFRRLEPGPNPDYEIGRALADAGFTHTPAVKGAVTYQRGDEPAATLAIVQAVVGNQGTGWTFTIDDLRRYYERVEARISRAEPDSAAQTWSESAGTGGSTPPPFFAALEGAYLAAAATLGRRTAELHLALASRPLAAFAPEPLETRALRQLSVDSAAHGARVLGQLETQLESLPEPARARANEVLQGRGPLLDRFDDVARLRGAGQQIRVHGDYHLGQVLRVEEDFVILDFEGEPARSLAERRALSSPLKDVAGMLRSFDYAASAALLAFAQTSAPRVARLLPWADAWRHWVSATFLEAYRSGMGSSPVLPRGQAFDRLLEAFVVDKALYELGYELNSRPDWVGIPLGALAGLAAPLQR
jgi:maltose alpha-D-glucosyltransferase/alpha-amylase